MKLKNFEGITLLMPKSNSERNESKVSTSSNDTTKNKGSGGKEKLVDFIHRYINYHERNRIGFSSLSKSKQV